MGLGPCTLRNGVTYPVCSTNANTNFRRVLYQQNPTEAAFIGGLDLHTDVGYQNYRGLKLSAQRRSATGVSLNGSYTLSRCFGTAQTSRFTQANGGYVNPDDPSYDAGYCDQDRRHLATLTTGYETPELANAALRVALSHWRLSGILTAQSGSRLNVAERHRQRVHRHRQPAAEPGQRRLLRNRTLTNYLNRAAFAQPAAGTLGDLAAQRRGRAELLERRTLPCRGSLAVTGDASGWSSAWRRSTCSTISTGETRRRTSTPGSSAASPLRPGTRVSCSSA